MLSKRGTIKSIALDFDGTLVESNNIKDKAFEAIFSGWPKHLDRMMKWHLANNTTDRLGKFRYFVEVILKDSSNEQLVLELTERFTKLTKESIINCPMVLGANKFLKHFINKVPMYLISATPQRELEKILKARDLAKYFEKIYGSQFTKHYALNEIIVDKKLNKDNFIYIGDSLEDEQAAKSLTIPFIYKLSDRSKHDSHCTSYKNFDKILNHINKFHETP